MAVQSLPYTHLSLARYARLLGINPVHFAGAFASPVWTPNSGCPDIWPRYAWQNADQVSHDELAATIRTAEQDIKSVLSYAVAPEWESEEVHPWPRHHRRERYNLSATNLRGDAMAIKTRWGKVNTPGRRAVALVDTATVAGGTLVYSDDDGDGFTETATITLPTTLTEACEISAFFVGHGGARDWMVRPARSKTISGGNVVLVYDSWLLIDPDLLGAYPTADGWAAIDLSTVDNFVTSLDVYRQYTDATVDSVVFLWEPVVGNWPWSTSGAQGVLTEQGGVFSIRDGQAGLVTPVPATYSAVDGAWAKNLFSVVNEPQQVKLWYQAGLFSDDFLSGTICDPLSEHLAEAIMWLTTARLKRPMCGCSNATAITEWLQAEQAKVDKVRSYQVPHSLLDNPFGTRRGEMLAWQRVSRLTDSVGQVLTI